MNGTVVSASPCYSFTPSSNETLVANFTPITYAVPTSSSPAGGGTTSGGGMVACGSSVTVCASANACYSFVNWTVNGSVVSASPCYTFTPSSSETLVANFTPISSYTITTSSSPAGGGTTSGGGTVACGSNVTVCASANTCYSFVNWTVNGSVVSASPCYTFIPSSSETLVANFTPTTYNITTSSSPAGGGTISGGGTLPCGYSVQVCANANSCYNFVNWTVNGTVVSASACYRFTLSSNETLVANFTPVPSHTITTSSSPAVGGTTSGGGTVACGSNVTVCASANASCYRFANWTLDGTVVGASACYTVAADGDYTLVANFTPLAYYTISTSSSPADGGTTSGGGTVVCGSNVTVCASPGSGFVFAGWTDAEGNLVSNSSCFALVATNNQALVANFVPAPALTSLYSFTGGADGGLPIAGLVQGGDGNFYGTTWGPGSGPSAYGTVFRISPTGSLTNLWSFTGGSDGANPYAGLVQGSDGNFYGTTLGAGAGPSAYGTVFRISPSGSFSNLWSFTGGIDGAIPFAGLVQGSDGNFYGTTLGAGAGPSAYGTVFRISPSGSFSNLWSFTNGVDGANPNAGLVQGSDGNFYGTTFGGGASGYGAIFQISPSGNLTNLWSFTGGSDGADPEAALVQGSDGNFYSTTEDGGASGNGTVFQISPTGSLTTLWSFANGADGANPYAGLVQGSDGNFYGTTSAGGTNDAGTVFQINTAGVLRTLYSFSGGADGDSPLAGLIQGSDGSFYSTTYGGGSYGYGTVFKLNPWLCTFGITTVASPSLGGSASGGGAVACGSNVTVCASANAACYSFTDWTLNGNMVSTSACYTFTADGNYSLVANFTPLAYYTITTTSSPAGGGSTSGGGTVACGSNVTVCASANAACYSFANWTDQNSNVVSTSPCYTFTATNTEALVANFTPLAYYMITTSSSPAGGGSTGGGGTVACGSNVTVCASVNPCYTFANWTDQNSNVVGTSPCFTFVASSNRTLVANFTLITYGIATSSSPSAGGSASGGGTVLCGSNVTVCASANSCYNFVNWTLNGTVVSTSPCYTVTPSSTETLVANFTPIAFGITTSSSPSAGGSASGGGTVLCGSNVTVCASANACYSFVSWTVNGTVVSASPCYTFTATQTEALVANFTPITYGITTSSSPAGGGSTSGGGTVPCGSNVTVCASASSCYNFVNWTLNAKVASTSACYTFTATNTEALVANFTLITYVITTSSSPAGGGTTIGGGTVACGSNVTVCASPGSGFVFADWTDTEGNLVSYSPCFALVATNNQALVANFVPAPTLTSLYSFTGGADGGLPIAGLVQGNDGNLYGTTSGSGSGPSAYGTVFRISPSGSFSNLWSFTNGADGSIPFAGLVQGSDGNFYGTTLGSGSGPSAYGTVFRISPSGSFSNLWSFTNGADGSIPFAGLVQGSDGNFYGTTLGSGSGPSAYGTVFRISPSGSFSNLWSFTNGADGANPNAGLVQGSDGNFYGTAFLGGANGNGTVFRISPSGSLTNLWEFTGGSDGAYPEAALVQGSDGNFYGTTEDGGASGNGTVFQISPTGSLTTLWSFANGADGANPYAGLLQGSDGNFYGTTSAGGTNDAGTVFQINTAGVLRTLYSFSGGADGDSPLAGLIQGSDGSFYSTTYEGGSYGYGTVFKLSPWLCTFDITTIASPSLGGSASGGGAVACGSNATVCASANPCYSFANWTLNGNMVSTSACYAFTADGNYSLVANFTLLAYTITTSSSPAGGGSTSGGGTRPCGSNVTVCASVNSCYNFVNWIDQNSNVVSTSPCYAFTATNTEALVANFTPILPYTITTRSSPAGGGTTSGGGTVACDSNVTVCATPSACYNFVNWTDQDSNALSTSACYTFTPSSNETLVANFTPILPHTITTSSSPAVGGTTSGGGTVPCGSNVTVCASANAPCSSFVNWTDQNGNVVSTSACYAFTPDANANLTAHFAVVSSYTITTSSSPSAGGSTSGGGTVSCGSNVTVCASANASCYRFANWTLNGNVVSTSACYNFTPSGNETLVANFTVNSGPIGGSLSSLWSFTGASDGADPAATLVLGSDGNFYGTTSEGGTNGNGTVFRISSTGNLTNLWSFTGGSDGANPYAILVQGSDGNFYGTTSSGGASGNGTVFRISPSGSLTNLWEFTGGSDGASPYAGLVQGSDSNLYGTTSGGGASGNGTVFRISSTGNLTNLWSFTGGSDGASPYAGLVQGSDGNFYGTTYGGGANGNGVVFRMSPSGSLTTLWFFTGGVDGANPFFAALVQGSDSNFYGTTFGSGSGPSANGTVFRISPSGNLTNLWSFTGGSDGASPYAGLVQGSDGNFYGTTSGGGASGNGTVFGISPGGNLTNLWEFTGCGDGGNSYAGLVQGNDGNFYGTTYGSGSGPSADGAIFRVSAGLCAHGVDTSSAPLAGGWTSGGGIYSCGSNVTVCATANPCYSFVNWTDQNSNVVSTSACYAFTVTTNATLVANFTPFTYTINPTYAVFDAAGGFSSVAVTGNSTNCEWTAISNVGWITITSGSNGFGDGTVYYSVAANSSSSTLIGTVVIAGQTFTVIEEGSPAACVPPPSGMVGWWPGDGNAMDVVGGNNGTLQGGATYGTGEVGQAFSFNGTGYASVPHSPLWDFNANDFTIELWANFNSVGGWETFVADDNGSGNNPKWFFSIGYDGAGLAFCKNNYGSVTGLHPFSPATQQWYHIAITRAGSTWTFYVNGASIGTDTDSDALQTTTAPLTIGQAEGQGYFNGLLDEVSIYNRALAPNEIASIYNAGSTGKCKPSWVTVTATSPASGASNVPTNAAVSVTFSAPMNAATLTTNAFLLTDYANNSIPGTVTYDLPSLTAFFTPASPLATSSLYVATVTTNVQDVFGNSMLAKYSWLFATGQSRVIITTNLTIDATTTNYDGQNVVIASSTVTISGAHSFNSVFLVNAATLVLNNGTLSGGTITTTNSSSVIVNGSGTLDGVTVNGELDVGNTYNGASLMVLDGLVLNGTALVGNPNNSWWGRIEFAGTQSVSGNGTVVFGDSGCNALWVVDGDTTLTIGSGITVQGQNGQIGEANCWGGPANVSVVNQGTISADVSGGTITVNAQPFTNQGVVESPAGTLQLAGTLNTAGLGSLQSSNGLIEVTGYLENSGQTLTLDGTTNVLTLFQGGTIHSGTVVATNGAALIVSGNPTFDGVTVNGVLDVGSSYYRANLTVTNGLVLNGTAYVGNPTNGNYGAIGFAGTQTLSGDGTVVFGDSGCNALSLIDGDTTLTIGSGITVQGQNGQMGYTPNCFGGPAERERGQPGHDLGGCQRRHDYRQRPAVHQSGCGGESGRDIAVGGHAEHGGTGEFAEQQRVDRGDWVSGEQRPDLDTGRHDQRADPARWDH